MSGLDRREEAETECRVEKDAAEKRRRTSHDDEEKRDRNSKETRNDVLWNLLTIDGGQEFVLDFGSFVLDFGFVQIT